MRIQDLSRSHRRRLVPHLIWDERLERLGYQHVWSGGETVGAGSTLDEDASPPASAPSDWGLQSLQDTVATGESSYVYNVLSPAFNVGFYRGEIIVTSHTLDTAAQVCFLSSVYDSTLANALFHAVLIHNGTDTTFALQDNRDGGGTATRHSEVLSVNTLYRWELMWDIDRDTVELWLNGSSVSTGSLTGSAAGWMPVTLIAGCVSTTATGSCTFYMDKYSVSTRGQIGAF